jgi:5'-3' exonuclease
MRYALPGIPHLTQYLAGVKYKKAWRKASVRKPMSVEHFCIDMNEMLHSVHHSKDASKTKLHFVNLLFTKLDRLLNIVNPTSSLVLAFDGPAPFAKMQSQHMKRIREPEIAKFTPGTLFMNQMEDVVSTYVLQRMRRTTFKNLSVFISGSDCPGEGELKLINWIQHIMPSCDDSVAICSKDGDVLVQAMTLHDIRDKLVVHSSNSSSEGISHTIHHVVHAIDV